MGFVVEKHTGGSPLLDNMELLQEDESSLGLSEQGMESAPTPQETVGPYLPRFPLLFVCLSACLYKTIHVTLFSVTHYRMERIGLVIYYYNYADCVEILAASLVRRHTYIHLLHEHTYTG